MSSAAHFGVHSVATQGIDHGSAFVETAACTRRVSKRATGGGGEGGGATIKSLHLRQTFLNTVAFV